MKFTLIANGFTINSNTDDSSADELLDALVTLSGVSVSYDAPGASAPQAAPEQDQQATIESVYGAGFVYEDEDDNPSLGFRQPVVGDFYLDPNPGDGSGVPKPRTKTTPTKFGPRIILTYR